MTVLCRACGTGYDDTAGAPAQCKICEDARQFVPSTGQQWLSLSALNATHQNKWQWHLPGLLSLQTVPAFAINQRAFILQTPQGNILWDCLANLDRATLELVQAIGGLSAIAISHPHYYTTMQAWAAAFSAPIYLHADDSQWIMQESDWIRPWQGDSLDLLPGVQLLRLGGHFAGGCVLHWSQHKGVILSGDIIQVAPSADRVSFMWSYPNMLPLSAGAVETLMARLEAVQFTQLYGAFEAREITEQAQQSVRDSAATYLRCLG